ncbi:MAG: HEAT repeat domain-containing protein [Deltaproteobacteria bacterium]|nr:HEAT repeat domain-containing protein [Deltaproteobacteria bacterium]
MKEEEKQRIISALSSKVEEIRYRAAQRLPEIYEKSLIQHLIEALADESWRIRKSVSVALATTEASPELIDALIKALGDQDNAGLRNSASEVLADIGSLAVAGLVTVLSDGDSDGRKLAADILGDIGDREAVAPLLSRTSDTDENVRAAAAEALGMIGDPSVSDNLIKVLQNDSLLVQLSCLDALERLDVIVPGAVLMSLLDVGPLRPHLYLLLGKQRNEEIVPILLESLHARSRVERSAAARALVLQYGLSNKQARIEIQISVARTANAQMIDQLRAMLTRSASEDREAAVMILGWTGNEEVVADLILAAQDESLYELIHESILLIGPKSGEQLQNLLTNIGRAEKVLVVDLLGHFGQPASLPMIIDHCLSDDIDVAEAAQQTLAKIGNPSVISTLVAFLKRNRELSPRGVVSSLIVLGTKFHDEVLEAIRPFLEDEQPALRMVAAEILCGVAHKTDIDDILKLFGDEDPQIRCAVVSALGRVSGEGTVDRLRVSLTDESSKVRTAAAKALGMRDSPEARKILQIALRDADPWVVKEALAALGRSEDQGVVEAILEFSKHSNGMVALEAVRAINHLEWRADSSWLKEVSRHPDPEVVKEVLSDSQRWPIEDLRQVLVAALSNEHWDVRMTAVKKIGELRDSAAMREVFEKLSDESDELVREAMEQILEIGEGKQDQDR